MNHVIGVIGIIVVVGVIAVEGVAVAVKVSASSELAGEVVVHCGSSSISIRDRSAVLQWPWCSAVIGGSVIGIAVAVAIVVVAVGAVYCCGTE